MSIPTSCCKALKCVSCSKFRPKNPVHGWIVFVIAIVTVQTKLSAVLVKLKWWTHQSWGLLDAKNSARQFKKNFSSFVAAKLSLLLTFSSVFTGVLCVGMDEESAYCQTEHQSQSRGSKTGPAVSMATSKQTSVSGFCSPPQGSLTQKQWAISMTTFSPVLWCRPNLEGKVRTVLRSFQNLEVIHWVKKMRKQDVLQGKIICWYCCQDTDFDHSGRHSDYSICLIWLQRLKLNWLWSVFVSTNLLSWKLDEKPCHLLNGHVC